MDAGIYKLDNCKERLNKQKDAVKKFRTSFTDIDKTSGYQMLLKGLYMLEKQYEKVIDDIEDVKRDIIRACEDVEREEAAKMSEEASQEGENNG